MFEGCMENIPKWYFYLTDEGDLFMYQTLKHMVCDCDITVTVILLILL